MTHSILPCFKAYDVRGRVPDELNEDIAQWMGSGMADILEAGPVVLGRDVRATSASLQEAVARGARARGREVIDIGLCGTEEVYFQTAHLGAAGGVMVTASHNPIDYNGMKLVREQAKPISGDSGLLTIRDHVQALLATGGALVPKDVLSVVRAHSDKSAYIHHLLGYLQPDRLKPLRIVVNAGNGSAGLVIDQLAPHLPFEFIRVHHDPDGSFPNGIPNPLLPENRSATREAVRQHGADMGLAWDGDFDRCFFFDGEGRFIEGYYLVGLLAQAMLQQAPGARIIHDPRLVWNTVDMVQKAGGIPVMSKTGHAFIKERMRKENAVYGGEMSAHHYFRDFSYCDSGMIPWLMIAELISRTGLSLAELVEDRMQAFPCSGEINFKVKNAPDTVATIIQHFSSLNPSLDHTDGVSADFGEWRFNLRSSNTEPLLRLNVETRANEILLQDRTQEISSLIQQHQH